MPTKIIDLDIALSEPITVKLAGKTYKLPGDIPAPLYLTITNLGEQDDADDEAATRQVYEQMLELFRVHQPELTSLPISIPQLVLLVPRVYGGWEPEETAEARPTKRAGTRSTSRKKKATSASSS